jgi:tRNA threonylcarbamoyladenosine biosynthesis protein TsaE
MAITTHSATQTRQLAARLAGFLQKGDIVVLSGMLGAGKTVFASGLLRELGVTEPVSSPTYTIARTYEGSDGLTVNHIDAYRLVTADDFDALGIDFENSISVVEWGEAYLDYFADFGTQVWTVNISRS